MMRKIIFIILLVVCTGYSLSFSDVIDRIVAVVDNEIILLSEYQSQLQLLAAQGAFKELDKNQIEAVKRDLLDKMVEDKLILILAREDTSITVTPAEVNEALEQHIKNLKSRFPSEESFRAQLAQEGLTEKALRQRYKDEVRNQLLKEKLLGKQLNTTNVNNLEVKKFYEEFKDSLPMRPASIKLAHILFYIKPGREALESKKAEAESLLVRLKAGESFGELAREYSDDPTAASGGDLGFFSRGDMVVEFERAAFALAPGQISDVVKTQFGYHIIKCEEKEGERIRCRHILISAIPTAADSAAAMATARNVYSKIRQGQSFEEMARQYSEDPDSRIFDGELGWYPIEELPPAFKSAIGDKGTGEILPPVISQSGIHILRILDRQPERRMNPELDWDDLKEFAKREKANAKLEEMVKKARGKYNVEIRDIFG